MWTKVKNKKPSAFTLIEILLVIAIIGLLATIVTAAVINAREQSRDIRRLADINALQRALEIYLLEQGGYPVGTNEILGDTDHHCLNASGWQTVGCDNPYIDLIPANPTPGGTDYNYTSDDGTIFQIDFKLEHGMSKFPAGPCRGLPAGVINCP